MWLLWDSKHGHIFGRNNIIITVKLFVKNSLPGESCGTISDPLFVLRIRNLSYFKEYRCLYTFCILGINHNTKE